MYDMNTTMGEFFELPSVMAFLEQVSPQIASGPAKGYLTPMTLRQLADMQPGMDQMAQAIIDIANGKEVNFTPVDPKTVKPKLTSGPLVAEYEIDDVDGKMYMLDHDFSGCFIVGFTKEMDDSVKGSITYNGQVLTYVLKRISVAGDQQMLGIFVRPICTEYGKEYALHVEGFTDVDGNRMDPTDYVVKTSAKNQPDPIYAEHEAVAQRAAEEGMVLLKNNGILPLKEDACFALFGAEDFRVGAVGAGKINPRYITRLGEAVGNSRFIVDANADTAMIVISRASGENYDNTAFKGHFYLTDEEEQLIADCKRKYSRIIAIINSGYPMDVRWTSDDIVAAVIWTGFAGMLAGPALVNILNGSVNPSGKMPDTWSLDYFDIPSSRNFYLPPSIEESLDADHDVWVDTVYEEDLYVGYRYFETFDKDVAFPFGFGLSYTSFEMESSIDASDIRNVKARIRVTNTGDRAGKEVVQIYAQIPDGRLEQAAKRLIGFAKTKELAPGESEIIELAIDEKRIDSYDEVGASFVIESGEYIFFVGNSIQNLNEITRTVVADEILVKKVGDYMAPPIDFTRMSKKDPTTFPKGNLSGIIEGVHELQHRSTRAHIKDHHTFSPSDIDTWSIEEMARFSVCASAGWGMQDTGVAGRVARLAGRDIPKYEVSDGNNGVNINKKNIGMPTSNLVCATWNTELAYEVGRVIAEEAKENAVNMILAPAMNIHRNPLCGRHPEYFSEDPLLAGMMAGHQCKGLEDSGVAGSVKHVCCNNAESTRKRNHSIVSKRALREIYLKAFEFAFEIENPASIMTAYNAVNGVFTAEDEEMIIGIFRNEFGLRGYVMTDWNSYDTADVAKAVQAGNCWMTPGTTDTMYTSRIVEGVANGTIDINRLRENCSYMYRTICMN